jgi:hypothetical protein
MATTAAFRSGGLQPARSMVNNEQDGDLKVAATTRQTDGDHGGFS